MKTFVDNCTKAFSNTEKYRDVCEVSGIGEGTAQQRSKVSFQYPMLLFCFFRKNFLFGTKNMYVWHLFSSMKLLLSQITFPPPQ